MRIAYKLLLFIISLVVICIATLYAANNGKLNKQIQHALQYYLQLKDINAKFVDCQFKDGLFSSNQVQIKVGSNIAIINDLQIEINFLKSWTDKQLTAKIQPNILEIWNKKGKKIIHTEFQGNFNCNLFNNNETVNWKLNNIKISNIKEVKDIPLDLGNAEYKHNILNGYKDIDFAVRFGKSTYLNVQNVEQQNDVLQIQMSNIPIMLYKPIKKLFPQNKLLGFLNDFIKSGYIKNGTILWNSTSEVFEKNLYGNIAIQKLDVNYNDEFPNITDMDLDVVVKGRKVVFNILSAYSSEIKLFDGIMEMDWQGIDKTILKAHAKCHGPAIGLTHFILEEQHKAMNKANIDLRKIKGYADLDVSIEIPLKPGTENTYNITANIPNASLNIFNDYVKFRQAKISGLFNGDQVIINGDGKINGFNSSINFVCNVQDETEFNHKLDIKTRFKVQPQRNDKKTKIAFLSLLGGNSIVNFQYLNKNSQGLISIDSDISNLDLYFDKLGIHKNKNDSARIIVNGLFEDTTKGISEFSVLGANNLNINGNVLLNGDSVEIDIKEIQNKNTDLSANIFIDKNQLVIVKLHGKTLDLSESDMLQFLAKERDGGDTKLNLDVSRVRLKNDIWLDDVKIMFECDQTRCFSGFLDSKIGSRSIEILLTADGDAETWLIKSSNAGALLKGIGAYNTMKSGSMILNINTQRKEIKPGQIIPILDGTFTFERFVLSDTPAMSKLVSFVSLPGFINIISGNDDIVFSGMNGTFSFSDNILTIKNSVAEGPYFNFNLQGNIDIQNKLMDVNGYVTPELYGVRSVVGIIPVIGTFFTGDRKRGGMISAPYQFKDNY